MKIKIKDKTGVTLKTSRKYCRENIQVTVDPEGIKDLKPENILAGVNILGVEGTASGIRTTGTAQAEMIMEGKTAYVDGEKVVGTLRLVPYRDQFTGHGELINSAIVTYYTQGVCETPPSLVGVTTLPSQLPILNLPDYTFNG
jgi:hypothetical protein